jgi:hypothetical protein
MRLTKDEIKLVAFLLGALLLGATVKHYRHRDRVAFPPPAAQAALPTGGEAEPE